MADPRFFTNRGPFRLGAIAEIAGAELGPGADPSLELHDVAALDLAGPRDLTFIADRRLLSQFAACRAAACIVGAELADKAPAGLALLIARRPYKAWALAAAAFYQEGRPEPGISPLAQVDATAVLGPGCTVGPYAVVEANARLGARVRIGPAAHVGPGVTIGDDSVVGHAATLTFCDIGARVNLHPGVRIGSRGFGFDMDPAGYTDVPQLGGVVIADDVEVGANSTIDRGAVGDTVIGRGCKIDNLVQIGHNVRMGEGCVVVAQAGVAGSAILEHHVVLAAQSGVAGHLRIAAGTQLAAQSGIMWDTAPGDRLAGAPAIPAKEYFRQRAVLARLTKRKEGE
ncbi:MAG: UDP-3-O-(3-hydroxymyristoyl)glucosamine N-acyltransferase [Alphaproteobacteria bacterium]|nr:UDP-3-O-(3-hydroxymyristoyl)glucosamine N-acyltransferase [Alphaproteobacteria bacterium]